MSKIALKTGPVVEGTDFYGREKALEYAWEMHLSKGTSLLLSAPRRVGKSSFAKKMLKKAEENGWKTLYLDLQGISTESEFAKLFKEELKSARWWTKAGKFVLKIFDSIKDFEVAGSKVLSIDSSIWRNDTYGKIRQLIGSAEEILIVVDELTIYLNHLLMQENGREKIEFFLEWLRSFRQTTKARWIFCSSVGIENFASMHQLSKHLNDFHRFHIGAFTEDEAKDFISRLDIDENVQFTQDHIQYILSKLVWYLPFFIQLLVEKINFLICVEGRELSKETIDEAYDRLITESYFNTWDERLNEYHELENNAREILKACVPDSKKREDLLANLHTEGRDMKKTDDNLSLLLVMLQNDGYLIEGEGKYAFRSPLLRDFWHSRFIG